MAAGLLMPDITVETNAGAVSVKLKDAAAGVVTSKALVKSFRRIGIQLQRTIMQNAAGQDLNKRSGNLHRNIFYRIEGEGTTSLTVRAGVDLARALYARILNFGGVIVPKRAKFLTIPVGPNVTGNGVMRVNARQFISNPETLGFTGSFVNRQKTAIMGVRPDGEVEPVFALMKSVTIKKTGFVSNALANNKAFIRKELDVAQDEIVKELADG